MSPKLTRDVIARTGLDLLVDHGLDGLSMRTLASALGVQAPTLYWHVRNKRELLDAMADVIAAEACQRLRPLGDGDSVAHWLADVARTLRSALLQYRDGARVFVGSATPSARPANEMVLTGLQSAGFDLDAAAQTVLVLLHYVTGSAIEEQARSGVDYEDNPYANAELLDAERFPLTARVRLVLFNPDADASFEAGLTTVLAGITATLSP
ncbi:TetR/AcrR family transcriptional regulator C-terminal domain-containing protein [Mycolicibacterium sp. YH-1]|uniref:TetR/AcrR family transcriptional regulator C-terminal domain-containing protein n=1 Tax=Mycolicibacterium sp. YH-1 TaxID=2908837 RepID=UPI001F4C3D2E|nr:TetR/AcrR family transcriptional regulator C-terminal domain-containing protein [Mycolicibacterium sp. YH-1]UNB54853.1 TetR/AcrR family transcriptional regulator C-terminal domain-containing protein [Mycolicibacterium sp. YH-1]